MTFLDFAYEGLYSARMMAGIIMFAYFVAKPRDKFFLRATLIYIAVVLFCASFAYFQQLARDLEASNVFQQIMHLCWYTAILFLFAGVEVFCFKGKTTQYLYGFTCGCLFECAVFGFFRLTYDMDIFVIRENTVVSYLSELLWSIVSYTVMFLCFARTTKKRGEIIPDCSIRSNIILVFLVALIMFLRFSLQYLYEFIRGTFGSYIINLALGVIPLTFLMVVVNTVIVDNLRSQNYTLNGLLHDKERQYLAAVENVDAINRKCHDIRRQLRALDFLDDKTRGQSIQEMENIVNIYDSFVKTSNAAINTLLSEKLLYCNEHKIKLTNIVDGDALQFMSPVDIYTMFGNIIDNAIEAVTKLEDAEKRIISMTVERKGNFLCIQTNNYFNGTIDLVDGLPRTSKEDKTYHGYGTRSIKHIAEKYGGSMNIQTDGEVFILQITIPIP